MCLQQSLSVSGRTASRLHKTCIKHISLLHTHPQNGYNHFCSLQCTCLRDSMEKQRNMSSPGFTKCCCVNSRSPGPDPERGISSCGTCSRLHSWEASPDFLLNLVPDPTALCLAHLSTPPCDTYRPFAP